MTILTKNSKILSTKSAILERASKYVYELNIDNFDTSTLKDSDVQWSIYMQDSPPVVSKSSGLLEISLPKHSHPAQLNLALNQFEKLGTKFAIEIDINFITHANLMYAGYTWLSIICGNGNYFTNTGTWMYKPASITAYKGRGKNYSDSNWTRYHRIQ